VVLPAQEAEAVLDAVAALCTQDAGRSAERSSAVQVSSAELQQVALPDAEHSAVWARLAALKQ
jgi:hypothetical protein